MIPIHPVQLLRSLGNQLLRQMKLMALLAKIPPAYYTKFSSITVFSSLFFLSFSFTLLSSYITLIFPVLLCFQLTYFLLTKKKRGGAGTRALSILAGPKILRVPSSQLLFSRHYTSRPQGGSRSSSNSLLLKCQVAADPSTPCQRVEFRNLTAETWELT